MKEFVFTDEQKQKFQEDGCLVIESFLSESECDCLREECSKMIDEMNPEEHKALFTTDTHEQMKDDYLLRTNGKIGFFWEAEAVDDKGNLLYPKHNALNKMGHALHTLSPPFNKVTFSEKIQAILRKLDFIRPVVPQSMYIFKSPGIGGAVNRHIDASFLHCDPLKLMGFWIALEDATLDNSCLKFVKGSHKTTEASMKMVRNPVAGAAPALVFEGSMEFLPFSDFDPAPVKKGSLVLIDGKVQHCSDKNTSDKSRHIYTFHVFESFKSVWSDRNWLQPGEGNMFPPVYDSSLH